jgi:NAD(P)-dependent dehydrogenase (short-subunit alcohol dehydrogenase family)
MAEAGDSRTVLVIGAGLLGGAAAIELARAGFAVAVADINLDAAKRTADTIVSDGGRAICLSVDICNEESIAAAVAKAGAFNGRLDGLYLNSYEGPIARQDADIVKIDLQVWRRSLEGTLTGSLIAMRHAIPLMLEHGGGGIVCTSSSDSFDSPPTRVAYPVSKFALHGLIRHVAARWGHEGIRCNVIVPGLVPPRLPNGEFPPDRKAFYEGFIARTPSKRGGEPRDVAGLVRFLLSDDGAWINGQVIGIDGGLILR